MAAKVATLVWKKLLPENRKDNVKSYIKAIALDIALVVGLTTVTIVTVKTLRRRRRKYLADKV
jgi:hypothetical protein